MTGSPSVLDYRQYVVELDETQFFSIKVFIKTLLNIYLSFYDMFLKNLERLENPRPSKDLATSLY